MMPASCLTLTHEVYERARKHLFQATDSRPQRFWFAPESPEIEHAFLHTTSSLYPTHNVSAMLTSLKWPGVAVEAAIDKAEPTGDSLILLHSHPGGFWLFSIGR